MRHSWSGWYGVAVASGLTLAIGCKDAPGAPESSARADDPEFAEVAVDGAPGARIPFAKLQFFFEFNSTDNDLGVQLLLDGDEWRRVAGFDPGNRRIVDISAHGRLQELGLTELFFESAEPSPGEVLALFPAGTYRFVGLTLGGDRLAGTATLSHDFPPAPSFSPSNGELVDRNNVVIRWNAIPGIASYQLIVENEALGVALTVDVPPSVTSMQVPPAFLQPGTTYKAEVLAIAANGNKTITEGTFVTLP
ncbi:MAG: fibronectin type III domain-containing protein [Gemmatimonadota bacterium]|nr:fibronectin type III domain-containing protein [Gemmatimonadota bacterium]